MAAKVEGGGRYSWSGTLAQQVAPPASNTAASGSQQAAAPFPPLRPRAKPGGSSGQWLRSAPGAASLTVTLGPPAVAEASSLGRAAGTGRAGAAAPPALAILLKGRLHLAVAPRSASLRFLAAGRVLAGSARRPGDGRVQNFAFRFGSRADGCAQKID